MTVYRDTLGRNLTPVEQDANIRGFETRIAAIEDADVGAGIEDITQSVPGGAISIQLTNGSTQGPFRLPVATFRWRGDWTAATAYFALDMVHVPGQGNYLVILNHTSVSPFDPEESDTNGDFYQYQFPSHISGKLTVATATLEPTRTDNAGRYHRCTHASGCVVELDPAEFEENDEMYFRQCGAGAVRFVVNTAATLNVPDDEEPETAKRGSVACVKYIGGNEFDLFGGLAESP